MVQMTQITSGWLPGDHVRLGQIVNVSHAVGYGCRNDPPDVMLVQMLLRKACANPPPGFGGGHWSRALRRLEPDGIFGPITRDWILGLQTDPLTIGRVTADGRVHPATSSARSSTTSRPYTIYMLNVWCHLRDPTILPRLDTDPEVPLALRSALRAIFP